MPLSDVYADWEAAYFSSTTEGQEMPFPFRHLDPNN